MLSMAVIDVTLARASECCTRMMGVRWIIAVYVAIGEIAY
jgi:hypothetical protein